MIFLFFKVITIKLCSMIILLYTFHPIKITRRYSIEIQASHHRTAEASYTSAPSGPQSHDEDPALSLPTNSKRFPEKAHPDMCQIPHFPTPPSTTNCQPQSQKKEKRGRQTQKDRYGQKSSRVTPARKRCPHIHHHPSQAEK